MNIADYLSELLGQHDEVSLPGLGYFVRERVNGYYNDKQAKFYPPHHRVKFVQELLDDDTFAQYVADKKNISLASSKYFVEKFISKLKEDAAKGTYIFSDLGQFHTFQEQLTFNAYDKIAADPAFYGYEPVNINKIGQPAFGSPVKTSFTQPLSTSETSDTFEQPLLQEEYYEEEAEPRRRMSAWLILLICIGIVGLALLGAYKFYPDKLNSMLHFTSHNEDTMVTKVKHPLKPDAALKTMPTNDTLEKNPAPFTDTVKKSRWEIIEGHEYRKLPYANDAVRRLKAKGILQAKILTDEPGVLLKITAGTYATFAEADSVKMALIKSKKISENSYTKEIPNQQ
jgi:hypothetical protein